MTTATASETKAPNGATNLPAERPKKPLPARIAYSPMIGDEFGIDSGSWKALVEAVFPLATSIDSVVLALSYCKARNLDPFKKNVHIVPIWNSEKRAYVDTIWPGIGELRTTAFRTGTYAGRSETVFGPEIEQQVGHIAMRYPEWAQVTVRRLVHGQIVEFAGPRVYWIETYSQVKRDDATPNSMWQKRPRGQLEKCAEAAALRSAFPEEIGSEYTNDEVGSLQFLDSNRQLKQTINVTASSKGKSASDTIADRMEGVVTTEPDEYAQEVDHDAGEESQDIDPGAGEESQEAESAAENPLAPQKGEDATAYYKRVTSAIRAAKDLGELQDLGAAITEALDANVLTDDQHGSLSTLVEKRYTALQHASETK